MTAELNKIAEWLMPQLTARSTSLLISINRKMEHLQRDISLGYQGGGSSHSLTHVSWFNSTDHIQNHRIHQFHVVDSVPRGFG